MKERLSAAEKSLEGHKELLKKEKELKQTKSQQNLAATYNNTTQQEAIKKVEKETKELKKEVKKSVKEEKKLLKQDIKQHGAITKDEQDKLIKKAIENAKNSLP